ncbi:hypothetical protein F5B22DRAFT_381730 [Xylaria bambusicola]|uniref:uncharacterized protein n=1 Tax=Xylaria bambusicola TaxID=326684 RepID=UPI0020078BAF|nr:uncharacterized protein F5B22DRAFT_381730 [Xylaria bambusicola]KAI0508731.1 hypothetical protein F5B22DRAFT_381730 [Xylaria bambusicola]
MEQGKPVRKACDLCYRRRIKCDGQKPRCSHCVIYDSECTRKIAARKWEPKKAAPSRRESALEARIKSLEAQLSTTLERLEGLEGGQSPAASSSRSDVTLVHAAESIPFSNPNPENNAMPLDSLDDILPVVEWYLATSNSLTPLFDPLHLLTAVKDWYYKPHTRKPAVWAMINVVLALAYHNGYSRRPHSINDTTYIKNAQSVLTDAIAFDTTLMHVQVLIGLAMLFRTSSEPTPAMVLIATALRLAHKIGLHMKSFQQYDTETRLQRDRVFWIAYILDRSISAQARISPIQLDSDIEIDEPSLEPMCGDLGGFVITDDGTPIFNFFRAQVQMARIQGLVHKYVYSGSAQKYSAAERARNIAFVHQELDAWSAQIPPEFHPSALFQPTNSELPRQLCMLFAARLSCRAMISYGSQRDSFHYSWWVESLRDYGERIADGDSLGLLENQPGWSTLIKESREYLEFFMKFRCKDAIFTMTTLCAHTTSLICLTAESMSNAHRGLRQLDEPLIDSAIGPLGEIVKQTGSLRGTYDAIQKLRADSKVVCPYQDSRVSNDFSIEPTWPISSETTDSEILQYLFTLPEGEYLWNMENSNSDMQDTVPHNHE